jgi:hypothetical protein
VAEIFERIGTTAETWQARLEKLRQGRLLGRFLARIRYPIDHESALRHIWNLGDGFPSISTRS